MQAKHLALVLLLLSAAAPAWNQSLSKTQAVTGKTPAAAAAGAAEAPKARAHGALKGVVSGRSAAGASFGLGGVRVYVLPGPDGVSALEGVSSDFDGHFFFAKLAPGTYSIRFVVPGWQEKIVDGVAVKAEDVTTLDTELTPLPPTPLYPAPEPQLGGRNEWEGTYFDDVSIHDLPTSRTVWSLLENQDINTITETNDTSQLETGTPARFGAHGASWTENQYLLNGFDASDPYVTGQALVDPDYAALRSVTDVTSGKPANFGASGTNLLIDTLPPPTALHGQLALYGSGRPLESDNETAVFLHEGFPGGERINSLYDGNGQIGGALPIGGYQLPVLAAFSTQQLSKDLGGFDAPGGAPTPIDAHADHIMGEITPYRSGGRRLDILYAGQQEYNSRDGAFFGIAPAATRIRNDNFHQFQARFRDALGAKSAWQAGFGVVHAILSSGLEGGALSTSTLDLPLQTLSGSAPLAQTGQRTRYESNAMYTRLVDGLLGSHSLAFGGEFDASTMNNRWSALNNMQQITVQGAGAEVIEWNTGGAPGGVRTADQVQNFSLFAQDAWRPFRWISFPLGLRLSYSTGHADGANNRISWTTLEPRAGVVVPLPALRMVHVTLLAGWARYGHQLQGQYLDYGNPNALGGAVRTWDDSNHDGIAQPGEIGEVLRVFGGGVTAIAPGIERPYTDEITIGVDVKVGPNVEVHIRGFRRDDHRLIQAVDTGVPLADYTPEVVHDPYIGFFAADKPYENLTVYNEMPSALGHDFITLGNFPGYHGAAEGVKLEAVYRPGSHWEIRGAINGSRDNAYTPVGNSVLSNDSAALDPLGNNPNSYLNNPGLGYFDRGGEARLSVYYNLPLGIHVGGITRWSDGLPYAPLFLVNGFNQGPFLVRAVPRQVFAGFRADFYESVDLRLSRKFAVRKGTLEGDLDVFNLLNAGERIVQRDVADSELVGRLPTAIQAPRTARLGLEWRF